MKIEIKSIIGINDDYSVLGYKFIPTKEDAKEVLIKHVQITGKLPSTDMSVKICKLKEFYSFNDSKSIELKTIEQVFNWRFIIDIIYNNNY